MPTLRPALWMFAVVSMLFTAGSAWGQDFPAKSIRIVTSAPGGGSDFTSRLIASGLTDALGQQVIVDNRGNFGGEVASRAILVQRKFRPANAVNASSDSPRLGREAARCSDY